MTKKIEDTESLDELRQAFQTRHVGFHPDCWQTYPHTPVHKRSELGRKAWELSGRAKESTLHRACRNPLCFNPDHLYPKGTTPPKIYDDEL